MSSDKCRFDRRVNCEYIFVIGIIGHCPRKCDQYLKRLGIECPADKTCHRCPKAGTCVVTAPKRGIKVNWKRLEK